MAILMRRGAYEDFNPDKMLPAEWAIILSGDPVVSDGKSAFICFAAGVVKRIATHEDMVQQFNDMLEDTIVDLTDGVNMATANANSATEYANRAGNNAYEQAQAAETAKNKVDRAVEDLTTRIDAGEFTGLQGPQGERGNDGAVVTLSGQYAFQIREDGHLYLVYADGSTPPDMYIGENGHLILRLE